MAATHTPMSVTSSVAFIPAPIGCAGPLCSYSGQVKIAEQKVNFAST
jgi:hypothetical protein